MKAPKLLFSFIALLFSYQIYAQNDKKLVDLGAYPGKLTDQNIELISNSKGIATILMQSCIGHKAYDEPNSTKVEYRGKLSEGTYTVDIYLLDELPHNSLGCGDNLSISGRNFTYTIDIFTGNVIYADDPEKGILYDSKFPELSSTDLATSNSAADEQLKAVLSALNGK